MHPVNEAVASIQSSLKSVVDVNPTFMSLAAKGDALRALVQVESQVAELRLRVMAAADDVADAEGFRSVAAWLAHHARLRSSDAATDALLARALDRDRPVLAAAVREGRVGVAQARVIAAALDAVPARVGAEVAERAEAHLVGLADEHDPSALARLGRRILELVDPDVFEQEEARALRDAERNADEKQRLKMRALGDGTTRISGIVPDVTAARLATYLHSFTSPRVDAGVPGEEVATPPAFGGPLVSARPRQLAMAFGQLLEAFDPSRLPIHGGDATHVAVTISLAHLRDEIGVATIANPVAGDGYGTVSAAQVRRLACTARIIPAVLGSEGEVLDLGRSQRLFSRAQRRALLLRDGTCRTEGCDVPGTWAEAHHLQPWSRGGTSDLANAVLLCARHHHRAHDPEFDMSRTASGDVSFRRRS